MRTTHKILTVAAAFVVALAIGVPAVADCGANPGVIVTTGTEGHSQIFTQKFFETPYEDATYIGFAYGGYGATAYCGAGGGCTPVSPAAKVSFWSQGLGDTTLAVGIDNGAFDAIAFGDLYFYSYPDTGYYAGARMLTGWRPGTDGCIGANNCLCLLLTDQDGDDSFWAITGNRSSSTFTTAINRGGTDGSGYYNEPIMLVRAAKPGIVGSTRVGTDVDLSVTVPPSTAGVYMQDGCNCGPVGFKVLQQIVPRGNMPPSDRSLGWVEAPLSGGGLQAVTPLGGTVSVRSTCGVADADVYLATKLYFDSGFSTAVVSGNSSRVECGTTLADPDDDPRVRPADIKPKPQNNRPTRDGRGK
jgi:hypothetical protein